MPTYQYACTQCGQRLEVVQSFTDATLTECASCQGRLRKVFSPVGVVFKGSGFYRTDNRTKPSENGSAAGDTSKRGSRSNGEAGADKSGTTDKSGNGSSQNGRSDHGRSDNGSSDRARSDKGSAGGDRAGGTGSSSTSSGSSTRGGSTSAMPTAKTA